VEGIGIATFPVGKVFQWQRVGGGPAPIGAENLNGHHGRTLLADNAQSFAEAVLLVLRDENLQCGHERVAAELAKQ